MKVACHLKSLCIPQAFPIIVRFGLPVLAWFSATSVTFSNDTRGHSFTPWNPTVIRPVDLQPYSDTATMGAALIHNHFGFIDGMVCPICRQGDNKKYF